MNKIIILSVLVSLASGISNSTPLYSPLKATSNNVDGGSLNFSDVSDEEVIEYYDGVEGLKGEYLKEQLTDIIDTDSYTTLSNLWNWMKITDRDWEISPEISESSYTFAGDTSYYFHNLYATYNGDAERATSNLNNISGLTYVDKEHCYPKSYGFKFAPGATTEGNGYLPPAGTDLHHLIASDHNNNNAHNNYPYGNVDTSKSYSVCQDRDSQDVGTDSGLKGYSALEGNSSYTVYEPLDEYKGDVARALLYMATRYNAQTDISSENPQLHLTDSLSLLETQALGEVGGIGFYGELTTMLEWNELDPVDSYEIHRNNLIFNNVQGNRNPYIDHPEWAEIVYDVDYSGYGAINNAPNSSTDAYVIQSITEPAKKSFALGEEFSCDGLEISALDGDGNIVSLSSEDDSLILDLDYDTKVLGTQTVVLSLYGTDYDLYDISVTNEGAVIGTGEGQVTEAEQAQAFSDYVVKLGTDNTDDRDIYETLMVEYNLMDSSSKELFDSSDDYEEGSVLFQTIKSNNMTTSEEYQEYWTFLISNPLYLVGMIALVIIVVGGAIFSKKFAKKRKTYTKKRK